ncbi:putative C2H2-type zinc-finger transcription factor orf8 [Hyphodiscus hymeniophilus]|uniref:C2H2-type zinc-finger transcription factor orf8 n=1 Tax=Hyphodiscus hymeniophilus TaxID=353542 RepID=A0A9P7AZ33_9HELO|nr:putative C2H2-type zinc-finger transcription factor orf8 [Hyphodiscus hymeniophilus]
MDSYYIDPRSRTKDSHSSRSRSNSHLSATASQFQDLNIGHNVRSLDDREGALTDTATTSTSPFLDPASYEPHQNSSNFISAPIPQQYVPFPILSDSEFDANWPYNTSTEEHLGSPPVVRVDTVCSSPQNLGEPHIDNRESTSRSNSFSTANMSVGVQQYDNRFEPAGVRQSYTWPHFDMSVMGDQFLQQQMSPGMQSRQLTPYNDPKVMPMYARSLSSSPPRGNLTPEQRELKRQRDHARRDSKTRVRRDRSLSNPYSVSQRTSPNLLARSITEFPSTLAPSPLLSEGSPSLSSSSYLAPPYSSPLMSDQGPSDMYGVMFPMAANDYNNTIPSYPLPPFSSGGAESSMQSFPPRPHSNSLSSSDQNSLYQAQQSVKLESSQESAEQVRVVHSRPKPQCWEHGCNGRQFSTFSNLLRHQREKSGQAAKSSCPHCGAEFTRTTARNGHMAHEKCKQRRNS